MGPPLNKNLIINYLPQFLTDDEFRNMFLTIGPLKSHKIVRDKTTGFSYGFGFVEFITETDAERAVKIYDFLLVYGKRIRVQHANKSDELSKTHNLYVKNIPSDYTETELDKLFEPYGKIVTSKVLMDLETNQSKNVGFVLFDTKAEAEKAIAGLNGSTVPGSSNVLYIKYADDSAKKAMKSMAPLIPHVTPQPFNQPGSGSLPGNNGFQAPSGQLGPMRNNTGNRFRFNPMGREQDNSGYYGNQGGGNSGGFFPPATPPGANNHNYNNSGMTSPTNSGMNSPMTDIPQGPGPFSLFVYNIGDDAEEAELWALFSPFGSVQKCTVMMDNDRRVCKGFGFVDFANAVEAANAIKNLNGFFYKGRQLNVSFKHKK